MKDTKTQEMSKAYKEAKKQMMESLKELNRCVRHRLHHGDEDLNYGHVGDVRHINDLLKEIITFIN